VAGDAEFAKGFGVSQRELQFAYPLEHSAGNRDRANVEWRETLKQEKEVS
jgi:hypothetical protein